MIQKSLTITELVGLIGSIENKLFLFMSVLRTTNIVHILVLVAAQYSLANSAGSFIIGTASYGIQLVENYIQRALQFCLSLFKEAALQHS